MPTIGQLAKILTPDTSKHSLKIRFDKVKAKFCVRNIDSIFEHMDSVSSSKNKSSLKPFLQYVKQYSRPDGNKVIFSTDKLNAKAAGWGRLTPDRGRGYVAVTRCVRHFLAYDIYSDHDIVNCHPVFIRQLFETYDMVKE